MARLEYTNSLVKTNWKTKGNKSNSIINLNRNKKYKLHFPMIIQGQFYSWVLDIQKILPIIIQYNILM